MSLSERYFTLENRQELILLIPFTNVFGIGVIVAVCFLDGASCPFILHRALGPSVIDTMRRTKR